MNLVAFSTFGSMKNRSTLLTIQFVGWLSLLCSSASSLAVANEAVATPETPSPSTITVAPGETLQSISKKLYGSSKKWRELYAENRDKIRNVNNIPVGTKLRVPTPEPISPPPVVPTPLSTPVPPPEVADLKVSRTPVFDLRLFGGITSESNSLKGGGFQSELPIQEGNLKGAELLFTPSGNELTYRIRYRRITTQFSTPSGYTPIEITSTQTEIAPSLSYRIHRGEKESFVQSAHLGLGYTFATRETTESTPNAVLTNQSSRGLALYARIDHNLGADFSAEFNASAYLPNSFYEKGALTGNHRSTLGWEFQLNGVYAVSPYVQISLGVAVIQQVNQFSGTGSRGSSDAQEISRTIAVPLELRIHPW